MAQIIQNEVILRVLVKVQHIASMSHGKIRDDL
jgi:hypothetical protein